MKPKINRSVGLPGKFPFITIVSDVSTKASVCGICESLIPKKQPRVYLLFKRPYRKFPEKVFMHAECVQEFIDEVPTGVQCDDCGTVCNRETLTKLSMLSGKSYQYQNLCLFCVMKPEYRLCNSCTCLFPKFYVSPVISVTDEWYWAGAMVGDLLCNTCAHSSMCDTIATKRVKDRENTFIDQQYLKILTDLSDDNFFGENDEPKGSRQ